MKNKIGILTFEQFQGRQNIGSTRIRVTWPLEYWEEAEQHKMGGKYDVMIYQKAYWLEHMKRFEGIKIIDMCDPDFFHWGYRIKECIDNCDAVTTSTIELAKYISKLTDKPVWCIPDRLNLPVFDGLKKDHTGKGKAKTAVWYGYSENFPMLDSAIDSLIKCGVEDLIVIASKRGLYTLPAGATGKLRVTNLPWSQETYNTDILRGDLVINPQSKRGRFKYKSNNKTINAWAMGMPVAHTPEELMVFMDEDARVAEGERRYKQVREEYDVKKTVDEYRELINLCEELRHVES